MYGYGGYPSYYTPSQPMPGQLEQLRMGGNAQMQQPAQNQQVQSGLIWVQGESGAKSYMVANGNSVLLMDSERQTFYIKSTDASGMPSMRTFDYSERVSQPVQPVPAPAAQPHVDYVTREEFNALAARIDALKPAKEETQNESTV